jgi:hypothetical protein
MLPALVAAAARPRLACRSIGLSSDRSTPIRAIFWKICRGRRIEYEIATYRIRGPMAEAHPIAKFVFLHLVGRRDRDHEGADGVELVGWPSAVKAAIGFAKALHVLADPSLGGAVNHGFSPLRCALRALSSDPL